jgi:hypothetical protein
MGLERVWVQTLDDGLVRADHVVGVHRAGDDPAAVEFRFRPFTGAPEGDGIAPPAVATGGP